MRDELREDVLEDDEDRTDVREPITYLATSCTSGTAAVRVQSGAMSTNE